MAKQDVTLLLDVRGRWFIGVHGGVRSYVEFYGPRTTEKIRDAIVLNEWHVLPPSRALAAGQDGLIACELAMLESVWLYMQLTDAAGALHTRA